MFRFDNSLHPGEQRGNALFLILIAVALFAALSYAMTQSGRGGGTVTKEQAMLEASRLLQYAASLEATVNRLRLANNCSDTQISFENSVVAGYVNPLSPADKSCNVFHASGGGQEFWNLFKLFPAYVTGASRLGFVGKGAFSGFGALSGGPLSTASESELYIFLRMIHASEICEAINKRHGLSTPVVSGVYGPFPFTGTYQNGVVIGRVGNAPEFSGKNFLCYQDISETWTDGTPYYDFLYILIVR